MKRRRTRHTATTLPQHHETDEIDDTEDSPYSAENPPSFRSMLVAMKNILFVYLKHNSHSLRTSVRKARTACCYSVAAALAIAFLLLLVLVRGFFADAISLCTPPPDHDLYKDPMVEYYVHGRGNGHYARSMAVIEALNREGVDVRMFLGRATIWNFFRDFNPPPGVKGETTAVEVNTIRPHLSFFHTLSLTLERIMGDCEVGVHTQKYPMLVITDGDAPGMWRAKLGGIPSVGISHGQIFSICKKPDFIRRDPKLNRAWNRQGEINHRAAWFTSWQIGTDFLELETESPSAVVARPPLRPEVVNMVKMRRQRTFVGHDERVANYLLYGSEEAPFQAGNKTGAAANQLPVKHRKVVVCYFRDHNGAKVIQTLLKAGFDVVLFESGYNKELEGKVNTGHVYGTGWVVGEKDRLRMRKAAGLVPNEQHPTKQVLTTTTTSTNKRRRLEDHSASSSSSSQQRSINTSSGPRLMSITERNLFVPFMAVADGIAASAGSQLLSECMYAKLPLLAFYRSDDDEQVLNVELSRKERVRRPGIPVFGMSLESLQDQTSSTYSVAQTEMQSFVDRVRNSTVSDSYFEQLSHAYQKFNTTEPPLEEPDPFHGMPDAAAIVLEIVRQVQKTGESR